MILKTYTTLKDGRKCTPYRWIVSYHGNILFNNGFTNRLFSCTLTKVSKTGVIHLLGFRWSFSISQ